MAQKKYRLGQIKYMGKCGGQQTTAAGDITGRAKAALETVVVFAAEATAGVVAGAGDVKASVVYGEEKLAPGHSSR